MARVFFSGTGVEVIYGRCAATATDQEAPQVITERGLLRFDAHVVRVVDSLQGAYSLRITNFCSNNSAIAYLTPSRPCPLSLTPP